MAKLKGVLEHVVGATNSFHDPCHSLFSSTHVWTDDALVSSVPLRRTIEASSWPIGFFGRQLQFETTVSMVPWCGCRVLQCVKLSTRLQLSLTENQGKGLLADPVAARLRGVSVPSFGLSQRMADRCHAGWE